MIRPLAPALAVALLAVAACSDNEPDAVQTTTAGTTTAVSDTAAQTAATSAALALGMTRDELEDADLLSATETDLGDVETLVLDAGGRVTAFVVELEGPGDPKVVVPLDQVTSIRRGDDVDLTTTLTAAQLQALPAWTPPAA